MKSLGQESIIESIISSTRLPRSRRCATLPDMYDLPSEYPEEPGLPDEFHDLQPQLLSRTLALADYTTSEWFTGSDLNVYYDTDHFRWHKRPDWFLAVGVPNLYNGTELRRSYVTWQEGRNPAVVVEFLSPGTTGEDLGRFAKPEDEQAETIEATGIPPEPPVPVFPSPPDGAAKPPAKFIVYEQYLQVPHYLVYSLKTQRLRYFRLVNGRYEEQAVQTTNPRVWLADLQIGLGIWQGKFEKRSGHWLRWCRQDGTWLLTDTEEERLAKEQERLAKEQAQAQILQAARQLLATGMTLKRVAELMNLAAEQIEQLQSEG